jgi:HEPN domain
LCVEIEKDLDPLKNDLKLLDEFYIPTRYPDVVPGGLTSGVPEFDDAEAALQTQRESCNWSAAESDDSYTSQPIPTVYRSYQTLSELTAVEALPARVLTEHPRQLTPTTAAVFANGNAQRLLGLTISK